MLMFDMVFFMCGLFFGVILVNLFSVVVFVGFFYFVF